MMGLDGHSSTNVDFDKIVEEDSISKVAAYMYSGGDFDDEVSEELEVSKESSDMVREFLRAKLLSSGGENV